MRQAMVVVGFPSALAKSIWLRRTVKPWDDRRPASSSACSFSVSGRTNNGACIILHSTTCPSASFGFAVAAHGPAEQIDLPQAERIDELEQALGQTVDRGRRRARGPAG